MVSRYRFNIDSDLPLFPNHNLAQCILCYQLISTEPQRRKKNLTKNLFLLFFFFVEFILKSKAYQKNVRFSCNNRKCIRWPCKCETL